METKVTGRTAPSHKSSSAFRIQTANLPKRKTPSGFYRSKGFLYDMEYDAHTAFLYGNFICKSAYRFL